jgi:hypothetical protein
MLTIGGENYSPYLRKRSLKHVNTLNAEPDSLDFRLTARAPKPPIGADVVFTMPDGRRLFGGVLMVDPERHAGHRAVDRAPACADWRPRVDARMLNDRPKANQTAGQILVALFAKYAPEFDTTGIDLGGPIIPSIRFKLGTRLTAALDRLAGLTGYIWDITPDKKLIWAPAGTLTAPMALTDTSRNFQNLTVSVSIEEVKNRIVVVGGEFPHPNPTVDNWAGVTNQLTYPLTQTPVSLDTYVEFEDSFNGIDPAKWVQNDVVNPTPPAGHQDIDGYLFTTIQQGATLAESGALQIVGGNSVWGASRLQSYLPIGRGDGGRRFELDVHAVTAVGQGRVGLWDPNNLGTLAGEAWGILFDNGTIKPSVGGATQAALNVVNYTAGKTVRTRIVPKATAGATLWVNTDDTGNLSLPVDDRVAWRPSFWVKLYETNTGSIPNLAFTPIFNHSFNGRVDRAKVFNRLYGATLTVAGVEKVLGLLGVDEDSGCDALVGVRTGKPILAFFGDTAPAGPVGSTPGAAIVLTYHRGVPIHIEARDDDSIAKMKAIENPTNHPKGSQGVYDGLIEDPSIISIPMAMQRARQELEKFANPPVTVSYQTRVQGLRAGQVLNALLTPELSGRDLAGSFLIQQVETASLGNSIDYEATVTAGSRLKGLSEYLREMILAGRELDDAGDENALITETVSGTDTITFTDLGVVTGPEVVGEDTVTFSDAGLVVEGPAGPFHYGAYLGTEDGGFDLVLEDGSQLSTESARYGLAAYSA